MNLCCCLCQTGTYDANKGQGEFINPQPENSAGGSFEENVDLFLLHCKNVAISF